MSWGILACILYAKYNQRLKHHSTFDVHLTGWLKKWYVGPSVGGRMSSFGNFIKLVKQCSVSKILIAEDALHPLIVAAQTGDVAGVQHAHLIDQKTVELAVHWAAHNKHIACLEFLAAHAGVAHNSWVLISAAANGDADVLQVLLPFSDPKTANSLALRLALSGNHWTCVTLLKDVSHSCIGCSAALSNAVKKNDVEAFERLLPFARVDQHNTQALIHAAQLNYAHFIAPLIFISEPKLYNSTALLRAVENGHIECATLLLPYSDVTANDGKILAVAVHGGHLNLVQMMLPLSNPNHHGRALVNAFSSLSWAHDNKHFDNIDVCNIMVDMFCTPVNCANALTWLNLNPPSYWYGGHRHTIVAGMIEDKLIQYQKQRLLDNIKTEGQIMRRKL